ncbi:MAG: hypothetical protein WA715_26560 [Candidatus Acidiferrum sp.]
MSNNKSRYVQLSQKRLLEAIKLITVLMRERNEDMGTVSFLSEGLPPSVVRERTKAFNLSSGLFTDASRLLAMMGKGDVHTESAWINLHERCETALTDLREDLSVDEVKELQQALDKVEILIENKTLSPAARELVQQHWATIAEGDPGAWLKASDKALQFFLGFFPIEGPINFRQLTPEVQREIISLVETLDEDEQWRFKERLNRIS